MLQATPHHAHSGIFPTALLGGLEKVLKIKHKIISAVKSLERSWLWTIKLFPLKNRLGMGEVTWALYILTLLHLCKVVCAKELYSHSQGGGKLWLLLLLVLMSLFPLLVTILAKTCYYYLLFFHHWYSFAEACPWWIQTWAWFWHCSKMTFFLILHFYCNSWSAKA